MALTMECEILDEDAYVKVPFVICQQVYGVAFSLDVDVTNTSCPTTPPWH